MFGGWDCQEGREGGTWLACNKQGQVALLTNIYTGGIINQKAKGRGNLVVDFLKGNFSPEEYLTNIKEELSVYNPFNLILFEPGEDGYTVWRLGRGLADHSDDFGPVHAKFGTFGVSNHPQHRQYIKAEKGETKLRELVSSIRSEDDLFIQLECLLKNTEENWPDPQIIEQSVVRGNPGPFQHLGPQLSSIFVDIKQNGYGTRTHSMILVDNQWNLHYKEITKEGDSWRQTEEKFNVKQT
ncbi:transport and Golgi organization protein 2 homolog [Eurytemora carolleeae]|uniref:transport and Golgi organization protein 2 homolog n=1 Tax=Eurytemora carolleeae TaxID=1294199 RepID=UPI000C791A75|nr:transport and Golgi organization protein 2 homolog [Eurytemora carolleeae]|eukprot:XP_023329614.1 transport and Golgi organization protein 2 homolog [Eurytemora affinis]